MSETRGGPQSGRGRGGARGRGGSAYRGDRGGGDRGSGGGPRGGGRGRGRGSFDLPVRPGTDERGDFWGRGRARGRPSGRGGRGGRGGGEDLGPKIYLPKDGDLSQNSQVQPKEDATMTALAKVKRAGVPYPTRPAFGTQGRAVTLFANYLQLKSVAKTLHRYQVDILEDKATKKPTGKKAQQVVRLLITDHFAHLGHGIVTDFKSTLLSRDKLLEEVDDARVYEVSYRDEGEDETSSEPANPQDQTKIKIYKVKCQYTGSIDPSELLNYLTSADAAGMFDKKPEILQAMNILLGSQPKVNPTVRSVGANRHFSIDPQDKETFYLGAGLEALRGYFVSVRAATTRLLVNVQVKYIACYQEGSLTDLMAEFQGPRGFQKDLNYSPLQRFLKGLRVQVTHIQRKNKKGDVIPRIKQIQGLATKNDGGQELHKPRVSKLGAGPRDVEFWLEDKGQQPPPRKEQATTSKSKGKKPARAGPAPPGRYISVAAFFAEHYNHVNLNPDMPVVNVGSVAKPVYLPVEVCMVEPGQQAKSKLSPFQTSQMLKFAVKPPGFNAQSIVEKGTRLLALGATANAALTEFGVQVGTQLVTVPGRVLTAPRVLYKDANSNREKNIQTLGGSWNMKSIKFSTGSRLTSWAYLFLDSNPRWKPSREEMEAALGQFKEKLNEVGVQANAPRGGDRVALASGDNDQARHQRENQISEAVRALIGTRKPDLILGILSDQSTEVYNCMKRTCDVQEGVRNVNVQVDKLLKGSPQYLANVGLKVNLKLGGVNQLIPGQELGIVGKNKTMLVGIDVTHPSPGSSSKAPSVAGMVASVDANLGQWPAELRVQTSRQERVSDLDVMLKVHLGRWAKGHKGQYPENIIIYRDGVSEGQYEMVVREELPLIQKACEQLYQKTNQKVPRISIVVVGKRHHTRFYPTKEEEADNSGNPHNGTVVDRGVTEARNWDFFLQAHTALKGTARPAHYFTVYDEIFCQEKLAPGQNAADVLENLTHKMCYLFGRATKAVSICPPAYYADLVCERARCYLSDVFDASTASAAGSKAESVDGHRVTIHPSVSHTMFYI
ncbi:putative RNA interference and gene silencing protein (Qde2) [Aspergillus saccharolyticus JOP 1030-1]|uniref:Putative RNA interference and gene silencing protein n=1 Tax=Aspergillus saccharolyticus JOP 1030-1 TaxID=1450539 RepID=A0A318ZCP6_9EURO|nr:putative RNA interference and gene silencing protein [Aspergillus saccharolyticus JOP 1030-1]PYH42413.1 putative RNA interference and gene silencing protein [Aspergillus saccharolyticus JOP 1030-1]